MAQKTIEVVIGPDGSLKIEAMGFKGADCERATAFLVEYTPHIAYLIWLAGPGTAIRVAGDNRPVMPWEYYAGATGG